LFKKRVFNQIELESKNFLINTEILAKARFFGFRIVEIGVDHFPRRAGQSTVRLGHIFVTLRELLSMRSSLAALRSEDEGTRGVSM
ncbi:MAG: hypothetical protein J3T61_00885, partial [Candidatus Brocadiales bacterium]|nr:hypothetical protein [Candidatus Bathyanammoxibius sp.]